MKQGYVSCSIQAHHNLDAVVEAAYDVDFQGDEEKIVVHLFNLYAELTKGSWHANSRTLAELLLEHASLLPTF